MQEPNYLPMHEKLYTHVHEYILVHNMDDTTEKYSTCTSQGLETLFFILEQKQYFYIMAPAIHCFISEY